MQEENVIYQERVIAFIDLLGFKELLQSSSKNITDFEKIKNVLLNISSTLKSAYIYLQESQDSEFEIEAGLFSDSLVVSFPIDIQEAEDKIFNLLNTLALLQVQILHKYKILMRGVILVDKLYHVQNIIFGDGLIKAQHIESEEVVYPRIVIDESLISTYRKDKNKHCIWDDEQVSAFIKIDQKDQKKYLDYLSVARDSTDEECGGISFPEFLEELEKNCHNNISNLEFTESIKNKYEWILEKIPSVKKEL